MQTSPTRCTGSEEGSPRGRRRVLIFSLVLGGAFVFTFLMLSLAVPAFAATGTTLTPGASLEASPTKSDPAGSPVVKADATVSGDGATASVDSPVVKADATVVGDSSGIAEIDLSLGEPSWRAALGPAEGSPSEAPRADGDGTSVASAPPLSGPAEPLLGTFHAPGIPPGTRPPPGFPPNPKGPYDPETPSGMVPTPISPGGPGFSAVSTAAVLLFLFGLLWFLLTSRTRVPPGNGRILLLPG